MIELTRDDIAYIKDTYPCPITVEFILPKGMYAYNSGKAFSFNMYTVTNLNIDKTFEIR